MVLDMGVQQAVGNLSNITGGYHDKVQAIVQQAAIQQAQQRALAAAAQQQLQQQRDQKAMQDALDRQQQRYNSVLSRVQAMPGQQDGTYGNVPAAPGNAGNPSGMSAQQAQHLGQQMAAHYGWTGPQWTALNNVEMREAGWNPNAVNKSSGAYGIPQALGHGHPFNLGDAPAQISWMLNYIKQRYGSPAAAWQHELSSGWY